MEIKFNGKELELSFGFKFLKLVDKALGFEAEQMNIGQGLNMIVPNLSNGNVVALGEVIQAATAHHKNIQKLMKILKQF